MKKYSKRSFPVRPRVLYRSDELKKSSSGQNGIKGDRCLDSDNFSY